MNNILNQEIKKVIIPKENKTLGMVLVYSRVISGKTTKIEEYITADETVRYCAKHELATNLSCNAIGRHMINYYNFNLNKAEVKRKFVAVYVKKSGEYYIKE